MSKHTVPLSEFANWQGRVYGVEMRSYLPFESYVPTDDIAVDVGRIALASRIGRIESIRFGSCSEQEEVPSPNIGGFNGNGVAVASFSAATAKTKYANSALNPLRGHFAKQKAKTQIDVNFGHPDLDSVNLHNPDSWSDFLDDSFKAGITEAAGNHLLKPTKKRLVLGTFAMGLIAAASLDAPTPQEAAESYASLLAAYNLLVLSGVAVTEECTLIPYLPLDRVAVAHTYANSLRFVKTKN